MRRLASSDSLGTGEIPICPSGPAEEKGVYGRGIIRPILEGLDEEECGEDDFWPMAAVAAAAAGSGEKKRRLGLEQVKALEKNFEVENKLEPERKVKLALELGLQPRQVAVWFQNRRARWKTKQLERDYGLLKANYDALRLNFDALHLDKETLLTEIKELRGKLADEERFSSIKEEPVALETENNKKNNKEMAGEEEEEPPALISKDGSSDSDSSAILNNENSPNHFGFSSSSSPGILSHHHPNLHHHQQQNQQQLMAVGFDPYCSSYSSALIQSSDGRVKGAWSDDPNSSSFFSDDQALSFSWYCSDQWN